MGVSQTIRCGSCGASLDTGKPRLTAGEVAELYATKLPHREGCTRNTSGPGEPSNAFIRPGASGESEIVGACHPEDGVTVLINTTGKLGSDMRLECRKCGRVVAGLGYHMRGDVPTLVVTGRPPAPGSLEAALVGPPTPAAVAHAAIGTRPNRKQRRADRRRKGGSN